MLGNQKEDQIIRKQSGIFKRGYLIINGKDQEDKKLEGKKKVDRVRKRVRGSERESVRGSRSGLVHQEERQGIRKRTRVRKSAKRSGGGSGDQA